MTRFTNTLSSILGTTDCVIIREFTVYKGFVNKERPWVNGGASKHSTNGNMAKNSHQHIIISMRLCIVNVAENMCELNGDIGRREPRP